MNPSITSFWHQHKRFLLWLYIASLALCLCFFMLFVRHGDNAWICFDSAQYNDLALQLAAGNGITNTSDGQPQTYRLPGYPLFLAGCYKVFSHLPSSKCLDPGQKPVLRAVQMDSRRYYVAPHHELLSKGRGDIKLNPTQQNILYNSTRVPSSRRMPGSRLDIMTTLLLQLIIASLIPLLVFIISLLLFPGAIPLARLSGIVAALHTGFILYAGMLATEPFFTLLLCIFFILLALGFRYQDKWTLKQVQGDNIKAHRHQPPSSGLPAFAFHLLRRAGRTSFDTVRGEELRSSVSNPLNGPPGLRTRLRRAWQDGLFSGSIHFLLAGIVLGMASLIRPVGHYIVIITIVAMLVAFRPFLTTLRNSGVLLCGWVCVVAPWLVRNYLLAGALFFHTLPGLHFLQYTAANIVVAHEGCSYLAARSRLLATWDKNIACKKAQLHRPLNDYERCRLAEHQTIEIIAQHPFLAFKDACIQTLKTCCGLYAAQVLIADTGTWPNYSPTTSLWQKIDRFLRPELNHRWLIIFIYWDLAILLFLLLGMIGYCARVACAKHAPFIQVFALMLIALIIGLTLAYGCARLRFPAEPFIIPLACSFWLWLMRVKLTKLIR